jgi:transketolase
MEPILNRILDIAHKHKLSHLGSYFSSVSIIDKIFKVKNKEDIFILSAGHSAVALYAVLEDVYGIDAEKLFLKHGGHPHRDEENKIYCSTGSLGLGLTVAVGRAMANNSRAVHCLISDGECAEGSIWEALRFIQEQQISNLFVYVNMNGYAAYDTINAKYLSDRLYAFLPAIRISYTNVEYFPFLRGLNAHYHVMTDEDYDLAKKIVARRRDFNEKVIR